MRVREYSERITREPDHALELLQELNEGEEEEEAGDGED